MKILTPEEIKSFLRTVNPKYGVFFLTAILTGMRRGELLGLQWGDIDWKHNQIHVKRALDNTTKQFSAPKTRAAKRKIDIPPRLTRELFRLTEGKGNDEPVFCNDEGSPLNDDSLVKRQFLPALDRAGVKRIRFHDLRHTNVSLRIEQGQNNVYISKQIGHSSAKITLDVYSHLMKEVNTEQAQKLDNALGFVEYPGSLSEGVRRLLEDGSAINEKGAAIDLQTLDKFGSGERI
jgi:integrase